MRHIAIKPKALHITEANFRNSGEKVVGRDGNINAGSTREVMAKLLEISQMIASGEMFTDVSHVATPDMPSNAQVLAQAYNDPEAWAELGSDLAAEIQERLMRDGFMRTVFDRGEAQEGSIPRVRIRTPNVRAVVSRGPGQTYAQYVRDRYAQVDEFTVSSNVRVMDLEMHQGSGDILEDKFYEAQEQILVAEDRVVTGLFRAATGIYNAPTYFSGAFTPTVLQGLRQSITDWRLPASTFLFANDILSDLLVGNDFSTWFDPITKYEIVQTGRIGSLLGLSLITDGYREENLQVLNAGESYMLTAPNMLGVYTDRGPVRSEPVSAYADGVAARGWALSEHISAMLANAKGIASASR